MMTHASITFFCQSDDLQTRREAAKARSILRKAGLHVPRNTNHCEVNGDIADVLETAQRVRGLVARGKLHRTTAVVKLGL